MKTMKKILLIILLLINFESFAQSNSTLPVQLVYFNATTLSNNQVLLQWGTATETNNYGYNLERSEYQSNWEILGFIPGNGNSFSPKNYEFVDSTITHGGDYYYRLRQFDFDGAENISEIVSITIVIESVGDNPSELSDFYLFNNYPNPFNPATTLQFFNPITQRFKIDVYNIQGEIVKSIIEDILPKGINKFAFDLNQLASGIYLIKLETKSNIYIQKIILLK